MGNSHSVGAGAAGGVFLSHASSPPFAGHVLNLPFQRRFKQGRACSRSAVVGVPAGGRIRRVRDVMVAGSRAASISDG